MARIKIIKSLDGQQVYPLTRTNAIYTEDDVRLDNYLGAMVEYTQSVQESIPTKVSELSDANEYATIEYVDSLSMGGNNDNYATVEQMQSVQASIPTRVSQLVDKEDYATVEWTTEQLGQLSKLKLLPVDELPPDEEALETVIYLVKDVVDETVYNQMLYSVEAGWKQIGTTKADLTEYAKTEEVKTAISIAVPAGVVMPYGGINAPEGYLFCRGQELSKLDYPELFNAIGYNYGNNPEDENIFYLPNLSGRVPVGLEVDGSTFGTIGDKGGEISHIMTREEMYMHDHIYNATHSHTFTGKSHSHTIGSNYAGSSNYFLSSPSSWESDGGDNVSGSGDKYPKQDGNQTISSTNTYHNHSCGSTTVSGTVEEESVVGFTNYTGESRPHNNLQPYLVMNYIIKY